jgi:Caspase domain
MKGIAICCGFNNYEEAAPLARAVNDATSLYAKLTGNEAFHSDPGLVGAGGVFTQKASAEEILAAFRAAAASAAELVWFSFSGHALVTRTGELRLLLPEWRASSSDEDKRRFSIGAHDLEEVLRPHLASKKFVVVLDTCYSGAFGSDTVTRHVSRSVEGRISSAGVVVISSCTSDQLAVDGYVGRRDLHGAFTHALIGVLEDHARARSSLSVLELFLEVKHKINNGQVPTLYVNGLTDDFLILTEAAHARLEPLPEGICRVPLEVPTRLKGELIKFLGSVVEITRRRLVGLVHAERQLAGLANEFFKYRDDTFVVPEYNSNAAEALSNARKCIVGCTTPAYFDEWHRSGIGRRRANELCVQRGGRVTWFFFMRRNFQVRAPGMLNVIRDHLNAKIRVVVVNVDSYGPTVLQEVFKHPRPDDLSSLECAFVDGKVFLKTIFAVNGDLMVEVGQGRNRCQNEYMTQLRPFLDSRNGTLSEASLKPGDNHEVVFIDLTSGEVDRLKQQLEDDL